MTVLEATPDCIQPVHDRHGGCYVCCDACNYVHHRCPLCGTELYHDSFEDDAKTRRHWLSDCRPDLIDGSYDGTRFDDGPMA